MRDSHRQPAGDGACERDGPGSRRPHDGARIRPEVNAPVTTVEPDGGIGPDDRTIDRGHERGTAKLHREQVCQQHEGEGDRHFSSCHRRLPHSTDHLDAIEDLRLTGLRDAFGDSERSAYVVMIESPVSQYRLASGFSQNSALAWSRTAVSTSALDAR